MAVIDPFDKKIGLTPPRFRADVTLITHGHFDHANTEAISGEPFLISGAGEYEARGVYVHGFDTFHDKSQGKERGMNVIYKLEMEDMKILHMGDFGEGVLRDETLERIEDVDILLIPVGGKYTITGTEAAKIVKQIEPRYVIPMHYKIPGLTVDIASAEEFLKEMGSGKKETQEKLVLKKRDLSEEAKTEVVVLKTAI